MKKYIRHSPPAYALSHVLTMRLRYNSMMTKQTTFDISNLDELDEVTRRLAVQIPSNSWVYLQGTLGAGKTTFSQRFIRDMGCQERVTSPTYALMQDYQTQSGAVIHCDLYRLSDPEELFEIGLLEQAAESGAIVLVEWPCKGAGVLPAATHTIELDIADNITQRRRLIFTEH